MNAEEIRSKIGFKQRTNAFGNIRLIGGIEFAAEIGVDPYYPEAIEHAKEHIKERILRNIFEDQRRELVEAMQDFLLANPMDYAAIDKARERLMKAAKYQPTHEQTQETKL